MTVADTTAVTPRHGYNHAQRRLRVRTLRESRQDQGLSLRALEQAAGVNRAILSQVERGRMVATAEETQRIAQALGVDTLTTRTVLVYEERA